MPEFSFAIERLTLPISESDVASLARLLAEAVARGAAVSFVAPLSHRDAVAWWQQTLASLPPRSVLLAARTDGKLAGTVQLQPAWAPNQPHRADVVKLLVDPASQGRGVGEQLMRTIEVEARTAGFTLLTLDAKAGTAAERLYRRLGWTTVGSIPGYAHDPDGPLHDAVFMYRALTT